MGIRVFGVSLDLLMKLISLPGFRDIFADIDLFQLPLVDVANDLRRQLEGRWVAVGSLAVFPVPQVVVCRCLAIIGQQIVTAMTFGLIPFQVLFIAALPGQKLLVLLVAGLSHTVNCVRRNPRELLLAGPLDLAASGRNGGEPFPGKLVLRCARLFHAVDG